MDSKQEQSLVDVLENVPNKTISCLDNGFVKLIDVMPRLVSAERGTSDEAIVQMARVSYGGGTKTLAEDRDLIRYLMRHSHTSPFEAVEFKFHCRMPIFVARQWIRHRTASVNEISARYSVLKDEFYYPRVDDIRLQSNKNKQGGDIQADPDLAKDFIESLAAFCTAAYFEYEDYLEKGLAREQVRTILPVNIYTEWYWKIDLHNLLHFLALRADSHAQAEIRTYAESICKLIQPVVPLAYEAWEDYHPLRKGMLLTSAEVQAVRATILDKGIVYCSQVSENKREQLECKQKLSQLGFVTDNKQAT